MKRILQIFGKKEEMRFDKVVISGKKIVAEKFPFLRLKELSIWVLCRVSWSKLPKNGGNALWGA